MAKPIGIDPRRLGIAAGLWWAVILFVWTWFILLTGSNYGIRFLQALRHIYLGYALTPAGSIIGAIWAFIEAFVILFIFAAIYNWLGEQM